MDTAPAEPWGGEIQRGQEGKVSAEEGGLRDRIQSEHSPTETSGQKPRMHTDPRAEKHASSRRSPVDGERSLFTVVPWTWSRETSGTTYGMGTYMRWKVSLCSEQLLEGSCEEQNSERRRGRQS